MPFTIPNSADAFHASQAEPDKVDIDILSAGLAGDCVVSGCAVTAQGSPDMTLAVAAGAIRIGGADAIVTAGNVTITTANATNPRFDLVVVDNTGAKSVTAGTAAASPVFPAIPANSIALAAVYVPANDTAIQSNQITDKRVVIPTFVAPHYTRWVNFGHSYGALHPTYGQPVGAQALTSGVGLQMGATFVERQWTALVRDGLGLNDDSVTVPVPAVAAASTTSTVILSVPEEAFLQSVIYLPVAGLTGANTNTRKLDLTAPIRFSAPNLAHVQFNSGTNLVTATQFVLASMLYIGGTASPAFADGSGTTTDWLERLHLTPGMPLRWVSTTVGTGLADPGGTVILKLASSYWNCAVAGSKLAQDGLYQGGFATIMGASPMPKYPGIPITVSANAAASATSITVDAIPADIPTGSILAFSNGVTAVTTGSGTAVASTSLSVSALSGSINKGETAHHRLGSAAGYQMGSGALWTFNYGVNEQTAQRESWRQSVHFATAWARCPARRHVLDTQIALSSALRNHWQYAAGNGAAAAWAAVVPTAPGYDGWGGYAKFTGAVGSTKPTAIRKVEPSFEGGSYVIGFLALTGNTKGASATITVDGSTPPQGTVTISTHNISTGSGTVVPMVKILTGLSAGAHTITVTIDSIDATDGTAQFLIHWDGPISTNPETQVRWLNVNRNPFQSMSDANVALFNTDINDVIAGTATPPTGNTAEPGHGSYVKVVDIDTPLGKAFSSFDGIGIHPSDHGHLLIADAVLRSALDVAKQPALAR